MRSNFTPRLALPLAFALLFSLIRPAQAEGQLMVLPASTRLFNNHDQTILVKNTGDEPMYLSITVEKVLNPGLMPEQKLPIGKLDRPGMLATPDKLTLGANQSRRITLKSLFEPTQEDLYRLYIVPVRSLKVEGAPTDRITAPMSVSIGYGVLVRHVPPPGRQHAGWTHRCESDGLTLEASGNVRQVLRDVTYAGSKSPATVALFPGTPHRYPAKKVTFRVDDKPETLECP